MCIYSSVNYYIHNVVRDKNLSDTIEDPKSIGNLNKVYCRWIIQEDITAFVQDTTVHVEDAFSTNEANEDIFECLINTSFPHAIMRFGC